MSLFLYYLTHMVFISFLPFLLNLKTVWISYFLGLIFFLFLYKTKNDHEKVKNNMIVQLILAGTLIIYPFIVSIISVIEYGSLYSNIIPGLLIMDTTLIFFQYFIIVPFSFIDSPKKIKTNNIDPMISVIVPAYN